MAPGRTQQADVVNMNHQTNHHGVVVPMVTPVAANGHLDESAVDRIIDSLLAGGVEAIFVAGTTGESIGVPLAMRRRLVERSVARVQRRALVYAGLGDIHPDEVAAGNEYLQAGVDAVVARPPVSFPTHQLLDWYRLVLDRLNGPTFLYNIPATTNVSVPLGVVMQLAEHPKLIGIKDSENDAGRLTELLQRLGHRPRFSILIGVGSFMVPGLKQGAAGIVPSVGNLIPGVCQKFYESAQRGDWVDAERQFDRMKAVTELYQKGRTIGESLSVLKSAMALRGLCGPDVVPPLRQVSAAEREKLREQMVALQLLDSK